MPIHVEEEREKPPSDPHRILGLIIVGMIMAAALGIDYLILSQSGDLVGALVVFGIGAFVAWLGYLLSNERL